MKFLFLKIFRPWRALRKLEAFRLGMVTKLEYIAAVDSTKVPKTNQQRGGVMPPIGTRLLTPREMALQILDAMRKNL
jgi:hypothetical protein